MTGAFATALFRGQWPNTLDEIKHDLVGASTAAIMAELILIRSLALQALSIDDRKSSTNPSEKDLS